MYNVYKGQAIQNEDQLLVIDSNERVSESVEKFQKHLLQMKEQRRQQAISDYLSRVTEDEEGNRQFPVDEEENIEIPFDEDGKLLFPINDDGYPMIDEMDEVPAESNDSNIGISRNDTETLQSALEDAQKIIDDAHFQAQDIIEQARNEGEALKKHLEEEGKKLGYREGSSEAMQEYFEKKEQLKVELNKIAQEYRDKEETMEEDLVSIITDIFEKAFMVQFSDKKDLLLHIVDNAILNIENSNQFQIKVSEDNYEFLLKYKVELQKKIGADAKIDIIMDPLLDQSNCVIETDGGVFDCSLGVQLDSLIRDLKTLSITRTKK